MVFGIENFNNNQLFEQAEKSTKPCNRDVFANLNIESIKNKTVVLDIDGTLVPYGEKNFKRFGDGVIFDKVKWLNENNALYLCSNSFEDSKVSNIAEYLKVKNIETSFFKKKPFPNIMNGVTRADRDREKVFIGDLFLSEGLMAKILKSKFIWVEPYVSKEDPLWSKILKKGDDCIFKYYSK